MAQGYLELPIYKKAMEIYNLVESITGFVEDYEFEIEYEIEQEMVDESIASMKEKAHLLQFTIMMNYGIERQYHDAMQNAVLVKHYAEEIVCDVNRLENTGLKESEFVDVFHDTLEEFRLLFRDWIKTFNKWRYYDADSGWGLFDNDDVVVVEYYSGERYDHDNELHFRLNNTHEEVWEDAEDDDYDEDEDFEDDDFDDDYDEDDDVD